MNHNEKAVENVARMIYATQWDESKWNEHPKISQIRLRYEGYAVAVLDALVPPGWTSADVRQGILDFDIVADHIEDILNGTANLGGEQC